MKTQAEKLVGKDLPPSPARVPHQNVSRSQVARTAQSCRPPGSFLLAMLVRALFLLSS